MTTWETVSGDSLLSALDDGCHEKDLYGLVGLDCPTEETPPQEFDSRWAELQRRFDGTWWCVAWPEHARGRLIGDASIHGPFESEKAARQYRVSEQVTLGLFVTNQPPGCDDDRTCFYIKNCHYVERSGVVIDCDKASITGPPEIAWKSYQDLARAIAEIGHGTDADDDEMGPPILSAVPEDLIELGYKSAAQSLCQMESPSMKTWQDVVREFPQLQSRAGQAT